MPTFVSDLKKMLPKDLMIKQGIRVMDNSMGSLCDLLKNHVHSVEEINDLTTIV